MEKIVSVKNGKIRGKICDGTILRFAGVPYAAPPIGELRWKAPMQAEDWEGILDCTQFSRCAYQLSAEDWRADIPVPYGGEYNCRKEEIPDEDCLYLNIWTPASALEEQKNLPVLCIIHGGGFESGSGGVPVLDGTNLAKENIVVVTVNYRLGVFGFLAHPELTEESPLCTSGCYGLLDQIQALRWVRDNIAVFGGDAAQVTVSGESAGSISVNALYESPLAKGLFSKAAAQSGAQIGRDTYCPQISLKQAEKKGEEFLAESPAGSIGELRKLSTEEVYRIACGFLPFRDGVVWPCDAGMVFAEGRHNDVPLFLGSNAHEGSIFHYYFTLEDYTKRFREQAEVRYGKDAEAFLQKYPPSGGNAAWNLCMAYGEKLFAFPIYCWAKLQDDFGGSDVYYYYFDRVFPGKKDFGAFHSSELVYFYRNLDQSDEPWEQKDRELMETMSSCLIRFVKTGNPNGEGKEDWHKFSENTEMVMEFGEHTGMIRHPSVNTFEMYRKHGEDKYSCICF